MRFDRKKFFDGFREKIDSTIEPEQVTGLEFLLDHIETDPFWKHIPQIAYALATVGHETAWSFQPVEEGYYLGDAARVRRFQKTLRYHPYFGRGYVQLTWKANYEKAGKILKLPQLVDKPDLAKDPNVAYKVLTRGMHQGWFTGKKLDDYIKGDKKDYKNARKIINGNDKDVLIAGYARKFEQILEDSAAVSSSEPTIERANQAETPTAEQPPTALPPQIITPPTDAVPVQTVTTQESTIDTTLKVWSSRFIAIPAVAVGWVGAFFAWLRESPTNIIVALIASSAAVAVVYIVGRHIYSTMKEARELKAAEAEKQRNHEVQMALINSAADKGSNTVALVPPKIEVGNAPTEVSNSA